LLAFAAEFTVREMPRRTLELLIPALLFACNRGETVNNSTVGGESSETDTDTGEEMIHLNGAVAKGPFLLGSTVNVSPVDSEGNATGQVFGTQTSDDLGNFEVDIDASSFVSLEANGFYYNEVRGDLSDSNLTLRGYYEVDGEPIQSVYINVVTHLVYGRVQELLTGSPFAMAVADAEAELLTALGVGVPGFDPDANGFAMNLLGGDTDENAYLFAVSTVLAQAAQIRAGGPDGPVDAHLQEIVNTISDQLAMLGQIAPSLHDELLAAQMAVDPEQVMANLQLRFEDLGWLEAVPDLNRVIDSDLDGFANADDNCWRVVNPGQEDADMNGIGDACECGNGVVDAGEVCDDGDDIDDNACSLDCSVNCVVALTEHPWHPFPIIAVGDHILYDHPEHGTWAYEFGGGHEQILQNGTQRAHELNGLAVIHTIGGSQDLWVSDGTVAGTTNLKSAPMDEGHQMGLGQDRAVLDDRLFFNVWNGEYELWATDGTIDGTQLVYSGTHYTNATVMNGKLYFRATEGGNALWETDGTELGTEQIALLNQPGGQNNNLWIAALADDKLVMAEASNFESLWVSDGTPGGTQEIGVPVTAHGRFVVLNGVAYFWGASGGVQGFWRTDGTLAGTHVVVENINPSGLAVLNGSLVFANIDVYVSDGTPGGTLPIGLNMSSGLGAAGSRFVFAHDEPQLDWEVWSTDGTLEGSHLVLDVLPENVIGAPFSVRVGPEHFFWTQSDSNLDLHYLAGCRNPS
jgi:ELWxxDGT repeat protein